MRGRKQFRISIAAGTKWGRLIAASTLGLAFALIPGSDALAQQKIESTMDLKIACETSLGNVVTLNQGAKLINGVRPPGTEHVATGCTLMLGAGSTFEADQVGMTFNGSFNVIGGAQTKAVFVRSQWEATAMSFDLSAGAKGEFKMAEAEVHATAGDITVRVAVEGQFQVQKRLVTTLTELGAMNATGSIRVSGGDKFKAEVSDTRVEGDSGVSIALEGRDSVLKSERAVFRTMQGTISFTGAAPKTLMEFKQLAMEPQNGDARVVLAGQESTLKIVQSHFGVEHGNVELRSGGVAPLGLIELVDSQVFAPRGAVVVLSSREAEKGVAKVGKSRFTAGADLNIESGTSGVTEVKESELNARNILRIVTGAGGNCISEVNTLNAPFQQICR